MNDLLADIAAKRWKTRPLERLVEMIRVDTGAADVFAEAALVQVPDDDSVLGLCLGLVSETAFDRLVRVAMERLAHDPDEKGACSVIAHASLQLPALLHPHLPQLFGLRPNRDTNYENMPWRQSDGLAFPHLSTILDAPFSDDRVKAWLCLLESRHEPSLAYALQVAASVPLGHPLSLYLHEVGFDTAGTPLYVPESSHLVFPSDHFTEVMLRLNRRDLNPTWRLGGAATSCRFGGSMGVACSLCSGPLHHLITLPGTSLDPGSAMAEVPLAVCLACLGWERHTLHFAHDTGGLPRPLDTGSTTPQFPAVPLKEVTVQLVPSPARWNWQDWGLSNGEENLHRVGGHASWIQGADYPVCPSCSRSMHFVLQLDSHLPTEDDGEWLWGSGGICYGFWCRPCRVSAFLWQCT